jgi:hypothetical protein
VFFICHAMKHAVLQFNHWTPSNEKKRTRQPLQCSQTEGLY